MYRMHAMFNDLLANADSHAIIDLRERRQNCNVLKMNVYVFCQMVQLFDEYTRKQSETIDAKGRKKVKSTESAYEKDKEKATRVLLMMCSLPIHWLFEPQIVEEDFVNCITQLCWKVLDNANMISKQKTLCVNVFSLLGIAVEKHRQTLNFALNLINFLRQKDSQVSLMVNLVEHLIANNDQGEIVNEIVRNICDLDKSELARDTGGTKALSVFLSDLANKCSVYFIETIPHLNALLDDEPYGLRNATLSIIGTLILEHYSDPDMDEEKIVKRDELLDLLEDHLLDSNTYSRGRALQVFTRLCDEKKLPLSKLHKLIQSVVHRLLDRSTYVRKQAVKFLSAFITVSPFVLRIPLPILKEQLDKESNRLKACLDKIAEEAGGSSQVNQSQNEPESDDQDEQMDCDAESEEEKENKVNRLKKKKEDEANENEITAEKDNMLMNQVAPTAAGSASLADLDPTDVDKQRILVKYLTDCVWYSDHIQKAIPLVCSLLYSKSITDIEEAIEFFVIAAKCEIDGALFGVRKLISLIFSNEKSVQDSILKAYTDIYIDSANFSEMGPKAKARAVVQCFTELVEGATSGEMVAMEEVLTKLMDNNRIDISYLNVMWERFTKNQPNTTDQDSRIAVKLIGMLANSKPELIRDNLDLLITHGLGERAEKDLALATNTLEAIRKSAVNRGKVDPEEPSFRLAADHEMFNRVYHLLMHNIDENSANWLPFANHVLKCFFLFHPFPNQISEKLLKECIQMIMKRVKTIEHDSSAHEAVLPFTTSSQSSQPMYPTEHANLVKNIPTRLFSHFLYLVGEAALNELLLIEVDIATELKIRDALKQLQEETKNKNRANAKTPSRRKSAVPKTPGENLDEEMGLAGAQADDETDFLQLICNEQIVESE